jgi:hypothetical protein
MATNNYFYGKVDHSCSDDIKELSVYLPDFEDPLLRFTEIPSDVHTYAKVWWAQLKGQFYSNRRSAQNKDPIEVDFEFGGFHLYDKLQIRDGTIRLNFHIAENGYFFFDTSKRMFGNRLEFDNYNSGDQILLNVDEVSADNLQADWDISTSGDQLQINSLHFGGIIDTLKGLSLDLTYTGKSANVDLDWVIGEQGSFLIEIQQDNDLTLNFNELFPQGEGYVLDGYITLDNQFNFDMEWKLDMGESAQNPGFFRVNKHNSHANIKNLNLYFTIKDSAGEEAYGIDMSFVNPKIYMDIEWYFDLDDIWPPYVYIWPVTDFQADSKDVKILWTDLWPGSDNYGEHHWIDVV